MSQMKLVDITQLRIDRLRIQKFELLTVVIQASVCIVAGNESSQVVHRAGGQHNRIQEHLSCRQFDQLLHGKQIRLQFIHDGSEINRPMVTRFVFKVQQVIRAVAYGICQRFLGLYARNRKQKKYQNVSFHGALS